MLQAAVVGLEPAKPYMLALTSNPDGTGQIEPIAQFMTNPAGAQIVNAVGPIRQIVDPATQARDVRRYSVVITVENGNPGRPAQLQQSEPRHRALDSMAHARIFAHLPAYLGLEPKAFVWDDL